MVTISQLVSSHHLDDHSRCRPLLRRAAGVGHTNSYTSHSSIAAGSSSIRLAAIATRHQLQRQCSKQRLSVSACQDMQFSLEQESTRDVRGTRPRNQSEEEELPSLTEQLAEVQSFRALAKVTREIPRWSANVKIIRSKAAFQRRRELSQSQACKCTVVSCLLVAQLLHALLQYLCESITARLSIILLVITIDLVELGVIDRHCAGVPQEACKPRLQAQNASAARGTSCEALGLEF
mmetsp:Transcript_123563/g.238283  ORF Transcript_123563/g.238283 Transcript_123563/m.238283 type:complete len:236 (+) Transcript_123563:192-899(+)